MGAQKILNGCSFMSRKVVGDDMNVGFSGLSGDHLGDKLHELSAGVAVSCLAQEPRQWPCSTPHREKECRGESIRIRDVRPGPERAARRDRDDQELEWAIKLRITARRLSNE